ncbi:MAG: hypothetical protein JNM56_36885 [Planctomycetia bacterium]|nr:hypothetical protein [Planctomycetia bacterium]
MMFVRVLGCLALLGPVCGGLVGCQRPNADRPGPPIEVTRDAAGDAQDAGKEVNGLALALVGPQDKLAPGKQAQFTLTLHNRSDKTFQLALQDRDCGPLADLRFEPELKVARNGHTIEPNYYPGSVHTILGGGCIALKFRLERENKGKGLFLPTQHRDLNHGCMSYALPADLKQLEIRFRLYDSPDANWSNLKFTEPRWSGECLSNPVTLKLE